MQPANPKYAIQISTEGRYEWRAVLADCTVKPARGTTIMEKSIHALMAKVLVAITQREQGEEQRAEAGKDAEAANPAVVLEAPQILPYRGPLPPHA